METKENPVVSVVDEGDGDRAEENQEGQARITTHSNPEGEQLNPSDDAAAAKACEGDL